MGCNLRTSGRVLVAQGNVGFVRDATSVVKSGKELKSCKVTLVGFLLPQERFKEVYRSDPNNSAQTQVFGEQFAAALKYGGAQLNLLSFAPVVSFPYNRKVFFRTAKFSHLGVPGVELGFVNIPLLKHVSRLLMCLIHGLCLIRKNDTGIVVIHGVHSPFLLFGLVSRLLLGTSTVVIVTDAPNVGHEYEGRFVKRLKATDAKIIQVLLKRFNGVIALTPALAQDYAPNLPHLVVEGIAPLLSMECPKDFEPNPPVVMYAGSLTRDQGVDLLIQAQVVCKSEFILEIYGRGELAQEIEELSKVNPYVVFGGFVGPTEMMSKLCHATILVNPRPNNSPMFHYGFPSKLMTYMASGKPVVSTELAGSPEGYSRYLAIANSSAEGLATEIRKMLTMSAHERWVMGQASKTFITEQKGPAAQGLLIVQFLIGISSSKST